MDDQVAVPTKTMNLKKKLAIGFGTVAALIAAFTLFMIYVRGDALRGYVKQQVQAIAAAHLNPTLTFDDFKYTYPLHVEIYNVRLTADTPDLPGGKLDVMAVKTMTLELAEIPQTDKPIIIEKIILDQPELRLVVDKPGGTDFYGFSRMVKGGDDTPSDDPVKLSDVFQIRLLDLNDALIVYDTREGDGKPMVLDKLSTTLTIDDASEGWHQLNMAIDRAPQFTLQSSGRLQLDDMLIDLARLELRTTLNEENIASLPPQLQQALREYQVTGDAIITAKGLLNLNDTTQSDMQVGMKLNAARIVIDPYIVPIDSLHAELAIADQLMTIKQFQVMALGGQADMTGTINMAGEQPMEIRLGVADMHIDKAMVRDENNVDQPTKYAGKLDAAVLLTGPLSQITEKAGGGGNIKLTEARIFAAHQDNELIQAGRTALELNPAEQPPQINRKERVLATFSFEGNKINFTDLDVIAPMIAARGRGDVYFDERLDLKLNGGPIEKVQSKLGVAGRIMGAVTDRLITLKITGTFDEPNVGVQVLGVGGGSVDEVVSDVVDQATQAVGDAAQDATKTLTDTIEDPANAPKKIIEGAGKTIRGILN